MIAQKLERTVKVWRRKGDEITLEVINDGEDKIAQLWEHEGQYAALATKEEWKRMKWVTGMEDSETKITTMRQTGIAQDRGASILKSIAGITGKQVDEAVMMGIMNKYTHTRNGPQWDELVKVGPEDYDTTDEDEPNAAVEWDTPPAIEQGHGDGKAEERPKKESDQMQVMA